MSEGVWSECIIIHYVVVDSAPLSMETHVVLCSKCEELWKGALFEEQESDASNPLLI